jgi:hypothetical protein
VVRRLERLAGGQEPPDEAVLPGIESSLRGDGTLNAHVDKKKGDFFADQDHWNDVYEATAAVIYHEYLVAIEKEEWPE